MKRTILTAVLAALACTSLAVGSASANHRRGGSSGGAGCGDCGSAPYSAANYAPINDCGPVAPAAPQYTEVQVTRYRQEWVNQEINEVVNRSVPSQESYTYTVQVPVTRQEKRTQTVYQQVQKQIDVPVTVCVPVTDNVKQMQTSYKYVAKEIDVPVTTFVRENVQRVVPQTTFTCVPEMITRQVPVCRTIQVPSTDCCGNCTTTCQRVMEMQPISCTVLRRVPVTTNVTINEVVCKPQTTIVKRTVNECVPVQNEVIVPVTRMVQQQQTVKRTVCEVVPTQQEFMVNVCSYETKQETGNRTVYKTVSENVKRTIQVCKMVPYTTTERVATNVGSNDCGTSNAACNTYSSGSGRGKLFGGLGGLGRRGCCR